jgi:subtilisin family serine protease
VRIPVVLSTPALPALRDVFEMQREGVSPDALAGMLSRLPTSERFRIDPRQVPFPTQQQGAERVFVPSELANAYLMAGTLEVDSIERVPDRIDGQQVYADAILDICLSCFDSPAIGARADVEAQLGVATLRASGLDGSGVAIAIVDTGINLDWLEQRLGFRPSLDRSLSWTPPGMNFEPGHYPVGHGTMCAYAALIAAPNATLIDIPAMLGNPSGGAAIGRRVSQVFAALSPLIAAWTIAFTPSGDRPYKSLVISNSWAMFNPGMDFLAGHPGRYADNPNHFFTAMLTALAGNAVDLVFAAGNCGDDCPHPRCEGNVRHAIAGANASAAVLTVAGCDVSGARVGYSSKGPGIPGMAGKKPDLAAYTHFLGSEALGAGVPDKGTSTSCPVAAGCIAALRTALPAAGFPSAELNRVLRETARLAGGWHPDVGYGLLDAVAAARRLALIP